MEGKWISAEKRTPEISNSDISDIVLTFSCHGFLLARFTRTTRYIEGERTIINEWDEISTGCGCCMVDNLKVTYWMPLPEPPLENLLSLAEKMQ